MAFDPITLVLVDDHELMTDGLVSLLNKLPRVKVVGTARNGRDGVALVDQLRPAIALLDIQLPILNGIDAAAEIHRRFPAMGIIMITAFPSHDYVIRSLRAGARGYVSKGPAF